MHKLVEKFLTDREEAEAAKANFLGVATSTMQDIVSPAVHTVVMDISGLLERSPGFELREDHECDFAKEVRCILTVDSKEHPITFRISDNYREVKGCTDHQIHKSMKVEGITQDQVISALLSMIKELVPVK